MLLKSLLEKKKKHPAMSSGNRFINFLSNVINPQSNRGEQIENEIEFHGQFLIEENSLNGLCFTNVIVPEEIILNVFSYLKPRDILNCSLVCKRWCNIAKSNILWHSIYNIEEYPKKAKNLPWYVFYCYFTTENFRNLIKNGNGQKQFKHWKIILNGGDKFRVEDPPQGSDLLPAGIPDFNGYTSCFATSFQTCSKFQKIELSPKRLLRYILKKYRPTLFLSEWYSARFDCGCIYKLEVRCDTKTRKWDLEEENVYTYDLRASLRAGEGNVEWPISEELSSPVYLKSKKDQIPQWAGKSWKKMEITTQNYPVDELDSIYFYHEGQDQQFWKGHYGTKMAGGVLKFLFESIEPTLEDIGDIEESY